MEWLNINGETYEIIQITTQLTTDEKHLNSIILTNNNETEEKLIELYESGNSFDFETKKWKFTGSRMKSITFDTTGIVVEIVSRKGGMKSILEERDKRIDTLLGGGQVEDN